MKQQYANVLVQILTDLLKDRDLVSVAHLSDNSIEVRTGQRFKEAYAVEVELDKYKVGLHDSYGVMTGAEYWSITPRRKTITAKKTNGFGDPLQFFWVVNESDKGEIYTEFVEASKKLRRQDFIDFIGDDKQT